MPFQMVIESEMERYRANTFWTKEPETLEWIRSFQGPGIFFDVGANVGIYSLYCALVHPGCRGLAVEPDRKNYLRLVENIVLNRMGGVVWAEQIAVSDQDGRAVFNESSRMVGSSGGQLEAVPDLCTNSYEVEVMTVDRLSGIYGTPTHVKIDIDGQELRVVHGMRRTLQNQALRSILIEVDIRSKPDIVDLITAAGFTTDNRFNTMTPHSRFRREEEGIPVENIVFTR